MVFFSALNKRQAMKFVVCAIAITLIIFYIMEEDSVDYGYCMVSEGEETIMHVLKAVLRMLYRSIFSLCHE